MRPLLLAASVGAAFVSAHGAEDVKEPAADASSAAAVSPSVAVPKPNFTVRWPSNH
jgi:hypothetical protein